MAVVYRRDRLAQCLMRTLRVELGAKAVEELLLRGEVGGRWGGGLRLERLMHTLMPPVLLRLAWCNALGGNAEFYPPD